LAQAKARVKQRGAVIPMADVNQITVEKAISVLKGPIPQAWHTIKKK